jgi:hypothetical protein
MAYSREVIRDGLPPSLRAKARQMEAQTVSVPVPAPVPAPDLPEAEGTRKKRKRAKSTKEEVEANKQQQRSLKSETYSFLTLCEAFSSDENEDNAQEVLSQFCTLGRMVERRYARPYNLVIPVMKPSPKEDNEKEEDNQNNKLLVFKCTHDGCTKAFAKRKGLETHYNGSHNVVPCELCGKLLKNFRGNHKRHMLKMHPNEEEEEEQNSDV